jgi:HlyD family secretion protein
MRVTWRSGLIGSFALVVLVLVSLGIWNSFGGSEPPSAAEKQADSGEPVPVKAVRVEATTLHPALDLVGATVAEPERMAVISPQLGGWVETVHVVDGQSVRAGELLVTLDSRAARVALDQARAAVAEKQAVLARLKRGYLPHELEIARQDRDKARAAMEGLRREVQALEELRARNEVSEVHLESKRKTFESAEAAYASAAAHLQLLEQGTPPEMIAEAEAQLASANATLEHAKLGVEFCSITSPIDGVVVQLLARQGQFFNQATPLATVVNLEEIFIQLRIPGAQYANVRENAPVEATLTSLPGQTFSGKIVRINGEADPLTGNIDAFAAIRNEKHLLRPGLGCQVRLFLPEIRNTLAVPVAAIADDSGVPIVTVIRDGKAYAAKVVLGQEAEGSVQVREGLSAGDLVVVAGGYGLPEGCPVRVVADLEAAKTAGL